MFTVIIAEKEHIDNIRDYQFFLKPFFDSSKVSFCEWDPNIAHVESAVPGLLECIGSRIEWRAVILCDEEGSRQQNPFDRSGFIMPVQKPGEMPDDFRKRVKEAQIHSLENAAGDPLVQLITYLCPWPMDEGGINQIQLNDEDFAEYLEISRKKRELREKIIEGVTNHFPYPSDVHCIARRSCPKEEYNLEIVWKPHYEEQYTRFYDWNMYLDKMRYLVYDILDHDHNNYDYDYMKFLYTILIFASNDLPEGCLSPNRIYRLESQQDDLALKTLLEDYDEKLIVTQKELHHNIHVLESMPKSHLTDEQAEAIFQARITIPMSAYQEADINQLKVNVPANKIGFSDQGEELSEWNHEYSVSQKTLQIILKRTRRIFQRAAGSFHDLSKTQDDRIGLLTNIQLDDLQDNIDREELTMTSLDLPNLYTATEYAKKMEDGNQRVKDVLKTRMGRSLAIGTMITGLVLFALGFIPVLLQYKDGEAFKMNNMIMTAICIGALLAVSLVTSLVLRRALIRAIRNYNQSMDEISEDVENSMSLYSQYLSHACNIMRGYAILDDHENQIDPELLQIKIMKKHILDIMQARERLHQMFHGLIDVKNEFEDPVQEPYQYDFTKSSDYDYQISFDPLEVRRIEYAQTGNQIEIPVNFVKKIVLKREEIYD